MKKKNEFCETRAMINDSTNVKSNFTGLLRQYIKLEHNVGDAYQKQGNMGLQK
jgi:hypothetical protein